MAKRILALLLVMATLLLSSCGEMKKAVNDLPGNNNSKLPGGSVEQPELDDDPTNDFTVRLRVNEEEFIPQVAINVYWNDGYNIHIAPIGNDGVARIDGLDGDYNVTLSTAPSGYSYDPNAYVATNDNRNIIIDMYDSGAINAKETSLYGAIRVNTTGVYTVTIEEDDLDVNEDGKRVDVAYFEFAPQTNGVYTIESWVNVVDDDVNPVCLAYLGSAQYKYGEYRVTDVGACGSYTRNFVHTVKIAEENISSAGSQVFTFGITAETKSGVYPATFTFAIKRDGGFDLNRTQKTMVAPKFDWSGFDFDAFEALAGGKIVGAEMPYGGVVGNTLVFDQRNFKVWEKSQGGDGIYHVYDEDKYASTGGYGPMLVAYINTRTKYIDQPFILIESLGSAYLTVENGTLNYKQFIEGWEKVATDGYYCVFNCPCHGGKNDGKPKACPPSCTSCLSQCSKCPEELMGKDGYSQWSNSDGVAPVTPELAECLQKLAIKHVYFADGEGTIDGGNKIYAYEDSQWLFACGYYE